MTISYILCSLGKFFLFWYHVTRKIWRPWSVGPTRFVCMCKYERQTSKSVLRFKTICCPFFGGKSAPAQLRTGCNKKAVQNTLGLTCTRCLLQNLTDRFQFRFRNTLSYISTYAQFSLTRKNEGPHRKNLEDTRSPQKLFNYLILGLTHYNVQKFMFNRFCKAALLHMYIFTTNLMPWRDLNCQSSVHEAEVMSLRAPQLPQDII
jgi:hypothetical protein